MVARYEVELRSRLENESQWDGLKVWLEKNAEFLGRSVMKSYLFPKPTFLRIRFVSGKNNVLITEKTGSYAEAGRREDEYELPVNEVAAFVKRKQTQGYTECALAKTTRFSYAFDGLKIELNKNTLGLIVEIEALTRDKKEIYALQEKIRRVMNLLKLKELGSNEYQKLMGELYARTLKPVTKYKFTVI